MSLTVKAFLAKDGEWDAEIRRFQVPSDVSSSFDYLNKKLCEIFPSLRSGSYASFWKGKACFFNQTRRTVRKCAFGIMRTAMAQISPRMRRLIWGVRFFRMVSDITRLDQTIYRFIIMSRKQYFSYLGMW